MIHCEKICPQIYHCSKCTCFLAQSSFHTSNVILLISTKLCERSMFNPLTNVSVMLTHDPFWPDFFFADLSGGLSSALNSSPQFIVGGGVFRLAKSFYVFEFTFSTKGWRSVLVFVRLFQQALGSDRGQTLRFVDMLKANIWHSFEHDELNDDTVLKLLNTLRVFEIVFLDHQAQVLVASLKQNPVYCCPHTWEMLSTSLQY